MFSYLYARQQKGQFIFRLEDTDQNRLVEGSEENLIKTLNWAGLHFDESPQKGGAYGPYRQSERLTIYKKHIQILLERGHAYYCFATAEELEAMRQAQIAKGLPPKYDRRHRYLTPEEVQEKLDQGIPYVVRMKMPEKNTRMVMEDMIRGRVAIETEQLDDQVILKADGFPTYHLASVVDDHLMKITDVVRGEEWLPSLPKHLLLYKYFEWEAPRFAHLPLILNESRAKLSKRHGDVAVEDFYQKGYLPEALVNFVALLGWNTSDEQEVFTMEELIEKFSFERVGKAGAVFDREKLMWMNGQHIKRLDREQLFEVLMPFVEKTPSVSQPQDKLKQIFELIQPNLNLLTEVGDKLRLFFEEKPEIRDPQALEILGWESAQPALTALKEELQTTHELDADQFKAVMKAVQKSTKIKGKQLWMPARCALTLEAAGPDLAQVAAIFGKEKCLALLDQALEVSQH